MQSPLSLTSQHPDDAAESRIDTRVAKRRKLDVDHSNNAFEYGTRESRQDVYSTTIQGEARVQIGHTINQYIQSPAAAPVVKADALEHDIWAAMVEPLKFEQMDVRRETVSRTHAATCRWLFDTAEHKSWRNVDRA
jgi:hypothetical protein